MYHDADADMLALLAPQLALMLAIEGSVQPVVGASARTSAYIQTLTATTEEIHASSQEVAASARRASQGEIGRASCRGRGEISVVAGSLKKKTQRMCSPPRATA